VVTTIAALAPVMWATGTGSEIMRRIAAPMVGGMISSTVLTLIVIPALYSLVLQRRLARQTRMAGPGCRPMSGSATAPGLQVPSTPSFLCKRIPMKSRLALATCTLVAFSAVVPPVLSQHPQHTAATAAQGATTEMADGEVRRIDAAKGTILLKHGEIKSINMGAMTIGVQAEGTRPWPPA
jgi:Cu/Ag efflux protein CusF